MAETSLHPRSAERIIISVALIMQLEFFIATSLFLPFHYFRCLFRKGLLTAVFFAAPVGCSAYRYWQEACPELFPLAFKEL
jgi:hypothetical protein